MEPVIIRYLLLSNSKFYNKNPHIDREGNNIVVFMIHLNFNVKMSVACFRFTQSWFYFFSVTASLLLVICLDLQATCSFYNFLIFFLCWTLYDTNCRKHDCCLRRDNLTITTYRFVNSWGISTYCFIGPYNFRTRIKLPTKLVVSIYFIGGRSHLSLYMKHYKTTILQIYITKHLNFQCDNGY